MAIINCSECGNQISDKAKKCVYCGKVFDNTAINTKEKLCEECGNPILPNSKECPNCGCPVTEKNKVKLSKKAIMILCSVFGVILIAVAGTAIYNSSSVQNYIAEAEQNRAELEASQTAFKEAKEAEKNNDYELAIKKYNAVVKEDKSYKKAQDKITELQNTYKNQLLAEAENYIKNKKYKEAIQNVDKVISVIGSSDELTELKQKYTDLKSEQYAKVEVTNKTVTPKNTSNWIFSNYVNFVFDVTNNSDKAIKGIEGTLTISDLFGKEIIRIGCDFTGHTIDIGETAKINDLTFECNEFMDKHMKLYNTDFSDLQFSYDITSIVYTDGTTIIPE